MNIKSFLGNIAKAYLVVGALSVSAFAGAEASANSNACAPAACATTCHEPPHCGWGYNPPAYVKCGNGGTNFMDSLGFRVDFLYWRPSADQLALGVEEEFFPITADRKVGLNESYTKRPDFKFNPGFRLGASHFCPCDCWDVAVNWTHYHNKSSVSGESDDLGVSTEGETDFVPTTPYTVFVPYWERLDSIVPDESEAHWTLNVDLIDLEFGHKYYVSSCFILRPHLGLRGARVNQSFHVESYADRGPTTGEATFGSEALFGVSNHYESEVHAKNNFLAMGPRLGLGLELDLGCGFSLVGEAAGSMLFGRAKKHSFEQFDGVLLGTDDESADLVPFEYEANGTRSSSTRYMSDLSLGLKWDHCINWCNQSHVVTLALLWEHHGFYGFNQFDFEANGYGRVDLDDVSSLPLTFRAKQAPSGDIFTQGLTFAVNVGF